MTTTRLALFDLDGTLIDSEIGIVDSAQHALARLGVTIPSREVLRSWIGPPLRANFAQAIGDDPQLIDQAITHYHARFDEIGWREHTVYPGIEAVIETLAARGTALAVVTSKSGKYARRIVESLRFGARFAHVYCVSAESSDSEKSTMIAQALADFGIPAAATAMVGDRHFDIEGARANHVRAIGVAWGFGSIEELESAGAGAIASAPSALVALLAG